MNLSDIAFKNLLRRKSKAAFILAGLIVGVSTVVAVISFTETMTHDINTKLEKFGANILIVPRTDNLTLSYGGISLGGISFDVQPLRQTELHKISSIKNAENVAAVGPMLLGTVSLGAKDASLAGIDVTSIHILKPWWRIQGRAPGTEDLLAGSEAARILGLSEGQKVEVNGRSMQISGLMAPTGSQDDQLIFTPLATAQGLLNKPGEISIVEVAALCHNCPIDELVAQISEKLPEAKVMAIQQVVKGRMETLAHFRQFSLGLSIVIVLIGGIVVLVTLMGSVRERTEEIGIFRAVGFRRSHVMRIIFLEAGAISLLAGLLGYGFGVAGIWLGLRLFGSESTPPFHPDPLLAIGAVLLAMVVGLAASAYPAVMASRMDPNQALKTL